MRALGFDLYVITDPSAPRGPAPYLEALDAEVPRWALCLRDHEASDAAIEEALGLFLERARGRVPVFLAAASMERVALAHRLGAGVHLPERGPSASGARRGARERVGVLASIHDEAGLARRRAEGVDALVLAPFAHVPGKGPPLSDDRVRAITSAPQRGSRPVLALGGIRDRAAIERALGLGCEGVAVRSPFRATDDGAATLRELRAWLDAARADSAPSAERAARHVR